MGPSPKPTPKPTMWPTRTTTPATPSPSRPYSDDEADDTALASAVSANIGRGVVLGLVATAGVAGAYFMGTKHGAKGPKRGFMQDEDESQVVTESTPGLASSLRKPSAKSYELTTTNIDSAIYARRWHTQRPSAGKHTC